MQAVSPLLSGGARGGVRASRPLRLLRYGLERRVEEVRRHEGREPRAGNCAGRDIGLHSVLRACLLIVKIDLNNV